MGDIIHSFEAKGFKLVDLKMVQVDTPFIERHYEEHRGKDWLPSVCEYMTSGPIVAMVWEGENVVATSRKMIGATNPENAHPSSLRGLYSY